jgi:hypothetical protein
VDTPHRPARKRTGLSVGAIVALVALVCAGGPIFNAIGELVEMVGRDDRSTPTRAGTGQPSRGPSATPALTAPTTIVDGGPDTSFDLPIGTAVRFADEDGEWTVAVLGVQRIEACEDALGGTAAAVVVTVQIEVLAGGLSVNPLTDFRYVGAAGSSGSDLLATCADPPLEFAILSAGAVRTGQVAFPGSAAGGTVAYGQVETTASWVLPGR